MSSGSSSSGGGVNWTLVALVAAGVALLIAYKSSPKDSTMRRVVRDAPPVVAALPERAKHVRLRWREHLQQAKATFQGARAESEMSLRRQLNDAKQRGSLGPG